MFLAIGLNPTVEWFMKHGMRRGLSVLLVLFVVITVLVLFVVAVAPVISDQIALITENAPGWLDDLQRNRQVQSLDDRFDVIHKVQDYVTAGRLRRARSSAARWASASPCSPRSPTRSSCIVLMVYFLAVAAQHQARGVQPRPRLQARRASASWATGSSAPPGAYVAGAFLVSVCAGISTLIFTFVVGLGDYAFALAFIVGLLSLIPVVGAVVSGIIITLLALTVSPTTALIAAALLHRLPADRVLLHLSRGS